MSDDAYLLALPYARAGLRVFPVDMRPDLDGHPAKSPPPGYLWKERATAKVNHVVEDFDEAARLIDVYQLGVGWALGLDGYLALDLDVSTPPKWWPVEAPVNKTPRGEHRIFLQPHGMRVGNSVARFPPPHTWGEVRGHGGYIVVAAWDRDGFDVEQLARAVEFPRPEWLTPASSDALAVAPDELRRWAEAHAGGTDPAKLKGYRTRLDSWTSSKSRHDLMVEVTCWAAREVSAGLVDATEAMALTDEWWRAHASERGRAVGRRELVSIWQWAVAQALADPDRIDALRPVEVEAPPSWVGASSWATLLPVRSDAPRITPTLATMDDGRALLHVDRLNLLYGDSGSGKSWLLAYAVAECVRAGVRVLVVDVEDTPAVLATRLRQLGVTQEELDEHVRMTHPDDPADPAAVDALVALLVAHDVRHVFLDSLGEAFGLDGVNENADDEVVSWVTRVVRRIIGESGAGVTVLDHVTKALDNPLHPSGSKRKRAAVTGTAWYLYAPAPFNLADGGRAVLRCAKDRHGTFRRGDDVAELVMGALDVSTGTTSLVLRPAPDTSPDTSKRPDLLVVAVNAVAAERGVPMTQSDIVGAVRRQGVHFADKHLIEQIGLAVVRGFLAREKGKGGAYLHTLIRPVDPSEEVDG